MGKLRHEKYFINENLEKHFKWIYSQKRISNFIPSAIETWQSNFTESLEEFVYQYNRRKSERQRFEEFIFNFFEVSKGKQQVIFCWRETEVLFIIF